METVEFGSGEVKREGLFVILHYNDHRRARGEENLSESGGSCQTWLMNENETFQQGCMCVCGWGAM